VDFVPLRTKARKARLRRSRPPPRSIPAKSGNFRAGKRARTDRGGAGEGGGSVLTAIGPTLDRISQSFRPECAAPNDLGEARLRLWRRRAGNRPAVRDHHRSDWRDAVGASRFAWLLAASRRAHQEENRQGDRDEPKTKRNPTRAGPRPAHTEW